MGSTSHTTKNLDCDFASILTDIEDAKDDVDLNIYINREDLAKFELSICGRWRIYPRLPSQAITLTTDAAADTYGLWTEVVPANIVPFDFVIIGVIIETISATGIYMIQFGDCAGGTTPGVNAEQGEIRFRGVTPIARSTEIISFGCRGISANRRVMARIMSDSGGDNVTISVVIRRYEEVSEEIERWPAFPW